MTTNLSMLSEGDVKMVPLNVNVSAGLKNAVGKAADKERLTLNEWVAQTLADKIGKPSLGEIHRKKPGRRRKVAS